MHALPSTLLLLLTTLLPTLSASTPSPALVPDSLIHLMPRHTLFLRQASDIQSFNQALGGFKASPITSSGDAKRPFSVDGDTFTDFQSAAQRSCDNQFQQCSQAANQQGNKGDLTVQACDQQKNDCNNAQQNAQVKDFQGAPAVLTENAGPDPDFPDFDLICEV